MKKFFVSVAAASLIAGSAASAFAAANPFEDVPADHWAYDAVAQLAADGVIEGYGDGTYRGDQEITRYEMAQMAARAMAKNPSGTDKALVDKLAAEFADELGSLGVRVAALEKKVDNMKLRGIVRYRYIHRTNGAAPIAPAAPGAPGTDDRINVNQVLLRIEPTMRINEHWTGRARLNYGGWDNMDTAQNENTVMVDRIYAQGDYKNLSICLGKLPYRSKADYGMVTDGSFAGGSLIVGKKVKVALNLGRFNDSVNAPVAFGDDARASLPGTSILSNRGEGTASYGSLEIYNDRNEAPFAYSEREKEFTWGVGWHHFSQRNEMDALIDRGAYDILAMGLGYRFTKNLQLTGAYSHAFGIDAGPRLKAANAAWESGQKNSYAIQLDYKGAHPGKKGSWGAFAAWRQLGGFSSMGWNTYKVNYVQDSGTRGLELGVSWTPMPGFMTKLHWFHGQNMSKYSGAASTRVNSVFFEACFYF
ncbi:MAG: S-layer homology domain-containing protein [Schwartzia sp.]|nr:S-layer homology domain-containing protein [Schwartzia sp. (in: firmicutes)]